jgi:asparagine synthase (glutamine-hydrolysing)
MCGIAGLINLNLPSEPLDKVARRLQAALQHRGPDDQGLYIDPNQQIALVHTRLAILDLSEAGHQPMTSSNGRYWITFNGEIYNFRHLRTKLESAGEQFVSQTDTEVILKLYQREGINCVKHLRGMFAFAIWDSWEKKCFLARDPLGIKPLYYWKSGSTLVFASELKAVLATGLPPISLNPQGLYSYLTMGSVTEPHTLIDGVRSLEAGHSLLWQQGQLHQSRYWQIQFAPEPMSTAEAVDRVRTALLESIQHHFVSDVPVGVFLSGGIDSSSVVALSRQIQSGLLNTYSIAFEDEKWNEGTIARRVAAKFETRHTEYLMTASVAQSLFSQYRASLDQPSVDGFNTFCVSKIAHDSGMKVVLSGLGGDELFGGYPSFQKVPRMMELAQYLQPFKPLVGSIGFGLERWSSNTQLRRIGDFLQSPSTAVNAYRSFRGIFSHWEATQILNIYFPDQNLSLARHLIDEESDRFSREDVVSYLETSYYMRNQLLRDSDVMSMAWGLELRVPFVDQVLLDTIASVPSSLRLGSGKSLLVQAVNNLPDWVTNRPKQGFSFPYEQWMNYEWQNCFSAPICPPNIPLNNWYRRWTLGILQVWYEQILC